MTDTSDQTGKSDQNDEGSVNHPRYDPTPQSERPDPTQELWSTERTEQLPPQDDVAGAAAQAHPQAREPVDTAVFGPSTPARESTPTDFVPAPAAAAIQTANPAAWPPPVPPRPTGPHAPAVILGLVCLAVSGIVLAQELGNLTVNWGDVGPLGFVAVGAVLVVLGVVGLLSSHRRGSRS
ncbi:MAG: hypothetical protein ABIQ13_03580 [Pedococcus sp.]